MAHSESDSKQSARAAKGWWRTVPLRDGDSARGRLRGLELDLHRSGEELWVAHRRTADPESAGAVDWQFGPGDGPPSAEGADGFARHLFQSCPEQVVVRPALADRAWIALPRVTLVIAPRQTASVFASTPVWVEVLAAGTKLLSVPVARPSDTWFGTLPDAGELCYGIETNARPDLAGVEVRADRAITEAQIENRTDELLTIEYLRIPAPHLSLWAGSDGRLRTETIRLQLQEVGEHAELEVVAGRPHDIPGDAERVGDARLESSGRRVIRSFQKRARGVRRD